MKAKASNSFQRRKSGFDIITSQMCSSQSSNLTIILLFQSGTHYPDTCI